MRRDDGLCPRCGERPREVFERGRGTYCSECRREVIRERRQAARGPARARPAPGVVSIALGPGAGRDDGMFGRLTTYALSVPGEEPRSGELATLDLGWWLEEHIRFANRVGHSVSLAVAQPVDPSDLMTDVASRTIRRVSGLYELG